MKNKLLYFSLIIAATFSSCKDQENIILDNSNGFIQLDQTTSVNLAENATDVITTKVLFGGDASQNKTGITVNFEVTTTDASRFVISPANGILEIPAGEVSGDISITSINNILVDGNIEIGIKLLDTSSKPIGIGGEGMFNTERSFTLVDDDCPIVLSEMVGSYAGTDNWAPANNGPSQSKITTTYDGTDFKISGLGFGWLEGDWWGEVVVSSTPVTVVIDPITGEFTIPLTQHASCTYNGALQAPYSVVGSGKYFSCSNSFELEYQIVQGGAALYSFTFKETLM